jgi:hypothetical protein
VIINLVGGVKRVFKYIGRVVSKKFHNFFFNTLRACLTKTSNIMAKYKFSKTDASAIDPTKAKQWMKKYEDKHPGAIRAYFFGADLINKIVNHPEAVGMRVYFSYGDEDNLQMVLIGAREDGTNIWPDDGKDTGGGTVGDMGLPCPPYC